MIEQIIAMGEDFTISIVAFIIACFMYSCIYLWFKREKKHYAETCNFKIQFYKNITALLNSGDLNDEQKDILRKWAKEIGEN